MAMELDISILFWNTVVLALFILWLCKKWVGETQKHQQENGEKQERENSKDDLMVDRRKKLDDTNSPTILKNSEEKVTNLKDSLEKENWNFSLEKGTNLDEAHLRSQKFDHLRQRLGIDKYGAHSLVSAIDGMCVRKSHFTGTEERSAIESFMAKLTSYDYRAQQIRLPSKKEEVETVESSEMFNWSMPSLNSKKQDQKGGSYSSRDIIFVIISCLDPFLLQDVLMKLAACQIAVPVLLPNAAGSTVRMILWGLRKISKSWCDDLVSSSVVEDAVVKHSFLYISAFRLGKLPLSKSNILNKFLGPAQGYDDQSFFSSFEQDSNPSILSQGTLECVWFLPGNEKASISLPFGLLNLRGNAGNFQAQADFSMRLSFLTIIFLDESLLERSKAYIENIASRLHVITLCFQPTLQDDEEGKRVIKLNNYKYTLTLIFTAGMSALEIGEEIKTVVKEVITTNTSVIKKSLESCVEIAEELQLEIDEKDTNCQTAKTLAVEIATSINESTPIKYKEHCFVFNKQWKEWSCNAKNRSWTNSDKVEVEKSVQEEKQNQIREKQASQALQSHMRKMCDLLKQDAVRQYFISWFLTFLNEVSAKYLKPLTKDLTEKSSLRRDLSNQIHKKEELLSSGSELKKSEKEAIQQLKESEEKIKTEEENLIKQFDDNALGFEHFIREFGQLVESYHYSNMQNSQNSDYILSLPQVAAKMLLEGHPLEILDGEVLNVPLKWLQKVFQEVAAMVGRESKVYVISVLGIQSSGKSTLLNSMFGVRFAASAGRCTRGVFLQLLPVEKVFANKIQCDFIAIVDTEGLRAPEKTITSFTEQDNELATFALCISDLTLINIGGQTVGEDMMNVLQIASHAFVRMKEVDLHPECRIVQQFVADVTAEDKNEAAMKAIVKKLDEAAHEAAKREGKEHLYRQFSDIFTLQNYDSHATNVQYIPSLWRGFMASPDYQYSVRVQKLKSVILQNIPTKMEVALTLPEFQQRITNVWDAIQREDFVFNFQNAKEVSLYQEVMSFYRSLIQPIRQELLDLELASKKIIANSKSNDIDQTISKCLNDVSLKLKTECHKVSEMLEEEFKDKRFAQVRKYSGYFQADLKTFETRNENSIRITLMRKAEIRRAELKKSSVTKKIIEDIHEDFAEFAQQLRYEMENNVAKSIKMKNEDAEIENKFQEKWKDMLISMRESHPLKTLQQTRSEIESTIIEQITEESKFTNFRKDCLDLLNCDISEFSSASIDISAEEITYLKLLFSDIKDDRNEEFEAFVMKIKDLAQVHQKFDEHCATAAQLIKEKVEQTFEDSNWDMIILYLCSVFVTVSHTSQQEQELHIVQTREDILEKFCSQEGFVSKKGIKSNLILTIETSCQSDRKLILNDKSLEKLKAELMEEREIPNTTDENTAVGYAKKLYNLVTLKKFRDLYWFGEYEKQLKKVLINLEKEFDGKMCKPRAMKQYVENVLTIIKRKKIPSVEAIKVAFSLGFEKFTQSFDTCLRMHITGETYTMKYAEPLDFVSMQSKVSYMKAIVETTFSDCLKLKPPLKVGNVWQFSYLPPKFSVLRKLDPCFVNMLKNKQPRDVKTVIKVVNEVKNSILKHSKPKTDFNSSSFLNHLGELIEKTDNLPKEVQASAIIHVGVWVVPIYARCHFEYEEEKNLAVLIEKDEETFKTEFKSLASNCQDELIAERCFDILKNAILDGIIDKLYTGLYFLALNSYDEFRTKVSFIGHALKDLFRQENYVGIADLLDDFENFSHNWILSFLAEQYETKPSILPSELKSCFTSIIRKTEEAITNTSTNFVGENFPNWLCLCTSTFEEQTKLACDQTKIDTIGKYLKVKDFDVLSKSCLKLLKDFEIQCDSQDKCDLSSILPMGYHKTTIKSWILEALPKSLAEDIFDSFKGCEEQCPFCGTVCDSTILEHRQHESGSHFPSGLNGWHDHYDKTLSIDICNSAVQSTMEYRSPDPHIDFRPYKDYEKDFPEWKIRGAKESEPTKFWKRVFVLFNDSLAEKFECKSAIIPNAWKSITDEQAMESLCNAYNLKSEVASLTR